MNKIKYLLTVVILLLSLVSAKGQYQHVPNYDFYIGTWRYESANEQFILKTKKYVFSLGPNKENTYLILGAFKYIKGGNVIYDTLKELDKMTMYNDYTSVNFINIADLPNNQEHQELRAIYIDPMTRQRTKARESRLSIYSKNPDKLKWHLVVEDWEPNLDCPLEFTIPYDMILTKVEE